MDCPLLRTVSWYGEPVVAGLAAPAPEVLGETAKVSCCPGASETAVEGPVHLNEVTVPATLHAFGEEAKVQATAVDPA